jgi:hypothetical protein
MQNVAVSVGAMAKILTTPIVELLGYAPTFLVGGIIGFIGIIPPLAHKRLITSLRSPITSAEEKETSDKESEKKKD